MIPPELLEKRPGWDRVVAERACAGTVWLRQRSLDDEHPARVFDHEAPSPGRHTDATGRWSHRGRRDPSRTRRLTPNTTYRFRLTATDAQGRVFQTGKLTTFVTTPSTASASLGRDVAVGAKIVAVSSQWSNDYRAANAVDGNLSTECASAGDGDRAFVTIDLGRAHEITGISFRTREMSDGSAITRTFAVVVDGRKRYGPFPACNRLDPRVVPKWCAISCQTVRLTSGTRHLLRPGRCRLPRRLAVIGRLARMRVLFVFAPRNQLEQTPPQRPEPAPSAGSSGRAGPEH